MKLENVRIKYLKAWPNGDGIYIGKADKRLGLKNFPLPEKKTDSAMQAVMDYITKHGPYMLCDNQGPVYLALLRKEDLLKIAKK